MLSRLLWLLHEWLYWLLKRCIEWIVSAHLPVHPSSREGGGLLRHHETSLLRHHAKSIWCAHESARHLTLHKWIVSRLLLEVVR